MQNVRELLLEIDTELEDYAFAISKARNPTLSPADRLTLVEASEAAWRRLELAHRRLERRAGVMKALPAPANSDVPPAARFGAGS